MIYKFLYQNATKLYYNEQLNFEKNDKYINNDILFGLLFPS